MSYRLVRSRRNRRRRNLSLPIHRGAFGVFVSDRGSSKKIRVLKKRRRKAKAAKPRLKRRKNRRRRRNVLSFASLTRKHGRFAHVPTRKKNRRRRNRRRRNMSYNPPRRRHRNRRHARHYNRPRRRGHALHRRRNRRRRNTGLMVLGRRHRRRNRGHIRRRRNPGFVGTFRDILTLGTVKDVVSGTVGLSASLWGPKLAGFFVWAPLGRGYGGVVTSVVTTGVLSYLAGRYVSSRAGAAVLAGGLLGAAAGLLSAVHCKSRQTLLPFESGLLACALPTMPPKPAGAAGYATPGILPGSVERMLADESAQRFNTYGISDYAQRPGGGLHDYAQFPASQSSSGMDASPESF